MLYLTSAIALPGILLFATAVVGQADRFTIYDSATLPGYLGQACVDALTSSIKCNPYVQEFIQPGYHGSLESNELTDAVCTGSCVGSLSGWFATVSKACAGKSIDNDGTPAEKFGGYMWAGVNETCIKDPKTKKYCNEIIDNFTEVDTYQEMPKEELCHICNIRHLAQMQASQYSIYDDYYKDELEFVYKTCGKTGPTDIPPPLTKPTIPEPPFCLSNNHYTTKTGDTCQSISNSTGVSGAALYTGNQNIMYNCLDVDAGLELCLPMTCTTYFVNPSDTCVLIEIALDLDFGKVRSYNNWINADCSNLQAATDFFGKNICVSPMGGTFTGTASPPPSESQGPRPNDGYSKSAIPPPDGAKVAEGTTLKCGKWHLVTADDTCSTICVSEGITISLFRQVNPSLQADPCTEHLKAGLTVCAGPVYDWNSPDPTGAPATSPTSTGAPVTTSKA